jgi:hypothetical protein
MRLFENGWGGRRDGQPEYAFQSFVAGAIFDERSIAVYVKALERKAGLLDVLREEVSTTALGGS